VQGGADRARRSDPDGPRSPISVHDLLARHARPAAPDHNAAPRDSRSKRPTAQNGQPGATRAPERPATERAGGPLRRAAPLPNGSAARTPSGRSDGPTGRGARNPAARAATTGPDPTTGTAGRSSTERRGPDTRPAVPNNATPATRPGARLGTDAPQTNGAAAVRPDRRRRPTGPGQPAARTPTSDSSAPPRPVGARERRPAAPRTEARRTPPGQAATRPGAARPVRPTRTSPDPATVALPRDTAVAAPTGTAATRATADRTPISSPPAREPAGIQVDGIPDAPDLDVLEIRPRRRLPKARVLAGLLALAVFGATAYGWAGKAWLGSGIAQVAALEPGSDLIVDADAQRGATNVLIAADATGPAAGAATLAVAHVPAGGGSLTVLSFPPALQINRPACTGWDLGTRSYSGQPVPAAARVPLSSAFEVGGPQCATRAVQQLSGIAITGFLGVDVNRIEPIADAVGGVAVCVPRPVDDGVLGEVARQPGRTTLNGRHAADYATAAAVVGDPPSGRARIERQQLVLGAVLQQALGGLGLLDTGQLGRLRPALGQAVVTDGVDLDRMLALGRSLQNLEADGVTFAAVPTAADPLGAVTLRDVDASTVFAAVRADRPLPAGVDGNDARTLAPAQLRVGVLNGTERTGLAATVAQSLGTLGFAVGDVGTAEQVTQQTLIRFSPDQAAAAALLATSVPTATSVPDPGTAGVLQLVLGTSYDDVLRPPAAAAVPAAATEPARAGCG
jgi:LCP family protein required for cell wall assembly